MGNTTVSLSEIERQSAAALTRAGATATVAASVARAIRMAEATGNLICGLYYLDSYCVQLQTGRVDGNAKPVVTRPRGATVQVDAAKGFAQPAFDAGLPEVVKAVAETGIASLSIHHSHTCTSLGFFTEQLAQAGLIGIGFTNAPACVAPPGGARPVLGTNPIAMAIPDGAGGVAFQFDQSTSATAIGKIRVAASKGEQIPEGWAVDDQGRPTTDAKAALAGSLVSSGGYKGYGFGLMAEMLAAGLTGSLLSVEAPPLKAPEGPPHDLGQFYIVIDPGAYEGSLAARIEVLAQAVEGQKGARLPGRGRSLPDEAHIDADLWASVRKLAGA